MQESQPQITYEDGILTCGNTSMYFMIYASEGSEVRADASAFSFSDGVFSIDLSRVHVAGLDEHERLIGFTAYDLNGELFFGADDVIEIGGFQELIAEIELTSFSIGRDGSADGVWESGAWYTPAWTSILARGDIVRIGGTLTSDGAENWNAAQALLYSDTVNGAFRPDCYVTDTGIGRSFQIAKECVIDWTGLAAALKNCSYDILYDWSDPDAIKISIFLSAKDAAYFGISTYTVRALSGAALADWYRIGISFESAFFRAEQVVRGCSAGHADGWYCPVCLKINAEKLEGALQTPASPAQTVSLAPGSVMKATLSGSDASAFWEIVVPGADGASYVDLQLANFLETGEIWSNAWGGGADGFESCAERGLMQFGVHPAAGGWTGTYTAYALRIGDIFVLYVSFTPDGAQESAYAAMLWMKGLPDSEVTFRIVNAAGTPNVQTGYIG